MHIAARIQSVSVQFFFEGLHKTIFRKFDSGFGLQEPPMHISQGLVVMSYDMTILNGSGGIILNLSIYLNKVCITAKWLWIKTTFLDASLHLYKRACPSVGPSLRACVRHAFAEKRENRYFRPNECNHAIMQSCNQSKQCMRTHNLLYGPCLPWF